jgi:putative methionine-R-sulfoxide reductase with GAF domain
VKLNTKFILAFLGLLIIMIALFFVLFPYNLIILYFESNTIKCFILLSVIIIIMAGIVTYFSSRVTKSIKKIDETVKILLNDETENIKKFLPTGKDEIAKLSESLNQHHKNIRLVYNIAYTIVKGKYNTQITTDPNNVLGNVLSELKEKLMTAKQERKYVEQESIRTEWYRQGISDFSDLLQLNYQDAQLLAKDAIKKIVKHMKVEQGGIFINEQRNEKEILVLTSAYGYDKIKLMNSEIEIGESLPGKCAEERKVIQINDLPEGYTFIGSGLGENTPKSLLLVPMIYENKLFGVIEIASLNEIFEYKLNFIQVVAERMASELSNIQSKLLTYKLAEDLKKQADEMTNHEKELYKQIKDLDSELIKLQLLNSQFNQSLIILDKYIARIEFDPKGKMIFSNKSSLETILKENIMDPGLKNFIDNNENEESFITRLSVSSGIRDTVKIKDTIYLRIFFPTLDENHIISKITLILCDFPDIKKFSA